MKTSEYKHLSDHDRVRIEVYLNQGKSQYEIARLLEVNRSTISREIKKRGGSIRGYTAEYAQKSYRWNKVRCGARSKIEENGTLGIYVIDAIKRGWSPEVIAGRLKKEITEGTRSRDEYVNHESIYQFVYESEYGKQENLRQYLRRGKKKRSKKGGRKTKRQVIPNRVSIEERPLDVERRKDIGHWEGDTIMYGKLEGINSLVERKTRYTILTKLAGKTPQETEDVVTGRLSREVCKTLTVDNGIENRNHEDITKKLHIPVYFCHPYSSWEKGTNENTNGLVRRYLPKKTQLGSITQNDVDDIAWELNNRPRKVLNYATPQEIMNQELQHYQLVAFNS